MATIYAVTKKAISYRNVYKHWLQCYWQRVWKSYSYETQHFHRATKRVTAMATKTARAEGWHTMFLFLIENEGMGKPTESFTKSTTSETAPNNTNGKLVNKVIERIDLESLSNTLADQLASKLADSINVDSLVATLFEKYGEALQKSLTDTILQRL